MPSLNEQIKTINESRTKNVSPALNQGKVIGKKNDLYAIEYANGFVATNIPGGTDLELGITVTTGAFPGRNNRRVVIGEGFRDTEQIKEIEV